MGRLLGLELCDFKSYKGVVKFGFGESDFISIIGPNGSGKSNLMDAISFVLGVRSQHLRSSSLKDLIYRGKIQNPSNENEDPSDSEDSPKSAYVKAFYSKTDSDGIEIETVEFSRSINTRGESFYKINNALVPFKAYTDALEDENVLVKARNFLVFQGDVEQVASQNSTELTKLFEQVSGSIQYKRQYEELNEQYKHALQLSSDGLFKKRRLQSELIHYKEGVTKDEKYTEKVDQRKHLWIQYTLWQLYQLENKKKELKNLFAANEQKIADTNKQIAKENKQTSSAKSAFSKNEIMLVKIGDSLAKLETNIESLKSKLLPIIQSKRSSTRKIEQIQRKIETFNKDVERQETILKNLEKNLRVVTKTKKQFEAELAKSKNFKYHLDEESLVEYNNLKEKYLSSGGLEIEEKLSLELASMSEVENEKKKYDDQIKNSLDSVANLEQEKDEAQDELKSLTESLNDKNSQHTDYSDKLKSLQSQLQKLNREETQANYKLRDTLLKIDELNADQRESRKEQKLRENVGSLRRLFPGVKGLVNELCKPKKEKYSTAISIVLGKNFESIVVDTIATAQQCISYLKEQRAGNATFIPLDTVEVAPARRLQLDQCILTIEALEYEPYLERAMQYVCGDSIICDDLEIAKNLKWNKNVNSKLVTLNGSLIQKSGLMTGGVSKNNTQNRWDKEEYKALVSLKDKLLANMNKNQQMTRSAQNQSREIELQLGVLNNEISVLRTKLNHNERLCTETQHQIDYYKNLIDNEYKPSAARLEAKINQYQNVIETLKTERTQLKSSIYKTLSNKLGFSLVEYENTTGEVLRKQTKDLEILQKEIINIESKISFEKDRLASTNKRITKLGKELKEQEASIENFVILENEIKGEIKEVQKKQEQKMQELNEYKENTSDNAKNVQNMEDVIQDLSMKLNEQKKQSFMLKNDMEKYDLERLNIFKNCQMTVIDLPLLSGSLDAVPMDKIDPSVLALSNAIDVDYDYLEDEYLSEDTAAAETTNKAFNREIDAIEEELISLQPNTHAHSRLNEVQSKFEKISKEVEVLKKHEKKIFEKFNDVKIKRKELFEKTFQHATNHIDPVYKELTKDPNSNVALAGGSASLTMEDVDEPYLAGIKYHATPPLKRFKEMEYLSGGEKTVAALALLFTINSHQPSPFFVLDEVDAALDVTNVQRVAAYIKRNAKKSFQFIVISLKNTMFERSDSLVGVFRDQTKNSSQVLTLDLKQYDEA